jgi:DNA polymerase III subunit delta
VSTRAAYNGGVAKASKTSRAASKSGAGQPGAEHRIVVLVGKELFLRTQYTAMLKERLEKEHGEVEVFKFEGDQTDLAEVLDECRSFGLMATHKMVIVDEADSFVNVGTRPMLERYAQGPSDQATLVLRAGKWNKGKLDDAIGTCGIIVKCDAVDEGTACKWVVRRAQTKYGSSIDQRAAAGLVERLGADLGRIDSELSKLATSAGEGNPITEQLISELVGLTREEEVWAIQSYLLCGDPDRAMSELRVVLGNSPRNNAVPVVFACSDLARKLMGASEAMAQGINSNVIGKELKLWPASSKDTILRTAKRLGPTRARALFDECVAADVASKSSSADMGIMLERLMLSFVRASR